MSEKRMSSEAKFDLARAASANERRNRPRQFVVASVVVFGASCLWAFVGFQSAIGANSELKQEREQLSTVTQLTEEIAAYRESEELSDGTTQFEPMPKLSSRLGDMAVAAGMQKPTRPANPLVSDVRDSDQLVLTTISYGVGRGNRNPTIPTQPLGPMLRWIAQALNEIEGLKVERLSIKRPVSAVKKGWDLQVSFARLERKQ